MWEEEIRKEEETRKKEENMKKEDDVACRSVPTGTGQSNRAASRFGNVYSHQGHDDVERGHSP